MDETTTDKLGRLRQENERRTLRTMVDRIMAPAPEPALAPMPRRGLLARLLGA